MPFGVDDLYKSGYNKGYNQGFKDGKECTLVSIDAVEDITDRMISIISEMNWEKLLKEANKRPQGEWKALTYHTCCCTNCHFDFDIMKCDFMTKMKFCPNCGADMRGEKEVGDGLPIQETDKNNE